MMTTLRIADIWRHSGCLLSFFLSLKHNNNSVTDINSPLMSNDDFFKTVPDSNFSFVMTVSCRHYDLRHVMLICKSWIPEVTISMVGWEVISAI